MIIEKGVDNASMPQVLLFLLESFQAVISVMPTIENRGTEKS
jgi:hypothetical protein